MRGDTAVINLLNQALALELTAINQYFLHARMYANWGFDVLNRRAYQASLGAMRHADRLIRRILFIEGMPHPQALDELLIGEDVPQCLRGDLQIEQLGREYCLAAITQCESAQDYVSREILENLVHDAETHIDYLETQLELIEKTGLRNYLQTVMHQSG